MTYILWILTRKYIASTFAKVSQGAMIMKSFGVYYRFIITTWISNIKTCFWILLFSSGLKISIISRLWSRNYEHPKFELQNLQHRYLIEWAKDGILYIHEQLRNMGQNIAMELPIRNQFIWKSNKSIFFTKGWGCHHTILIL
jgi:hypothetical protein